MSRQIRTATALALIALVAGSGVARAQDEDQPDDKWSNSTELSLVATQGNSEVFTLGFKNLYKKWWGDDKKGLMQWKFEGTSSDKADPRKVNAEIDFTQPIDPDDPCATPGVVCSTIDQPLEDNIERYLVEGRYDRKVTKKAFWYVLGSWDRNLTDGSGIESRYIGTAGMGNVWWDDDDLKFSTNYGLSYTDREETSPDPDKEDQYLGFRFDWAYSNKLGENVTYRNTWTVNASLEDSEDYNFDMINGIVVSMTERIALTVSVQWLYNNFPALEDVDLNCVNPDPTDARTTIPCDLVCVDGDTGVFDPDCLDGSVPLNDETKIRKKKSDFILNTGLVIKL